MTLKTGRTEGMKTGEEFDGSSEEIEADGTFQRRFYLVVLLPQIPERVRGGGRRHGQRSKGGRRSSSVVVLILMSVLRGAMKEMKVIGNL